MMLKPTRNLALRPQSEKSRIATFAEARQAVAPVEHPAANRIDISAAIRKRPLLAAAPLVLALLAGLPYVMRNTKQEYRVEASIYVSPTYFKNLQTDREQLQVPYGTLVNQQVLTIRRYDVLSESLKRLETKGIQWRNSGESEAASIARLLSKLEIRPIPDSYEVLIGLSGPKQEWLAPIVNTISDTYLEKQKAEELAETSSRFTSLNSAKDRMEAALRHRLEQQAQVSANLKVSNVDRAQPVDDTLLAGARQALEEARRKRIEAEGQIQVMSAAAANGKNPLSVVAEESAAGDAGLRTLSNFLLQRIVDLRTRIEGLTPEHPLRQSTEKEVAGLNAQLKELPRGHVTDASSRLMTKMRADLDRTQWLESQLEKQVQAGLVNVKGVAKQVQEAQGLGQEITRLRTSLGAVTTSLELVVQEAAPRNLRVFSTARTPIAPSKSNFESSLAMLALAAFALSIGLCVAVDLLDQRIFCPSDVKRAVGLTPVGLMVERTPETDAFAEEQFWRLVNGIQRAIAVQDAKSIVFTPLRLARNPATLVPDIARALTSCGLKVAILDAKIRRGGESELTERKESANQEDSVQTGAMQPVSNAIANRMDMDQTKELGRIPSVGRETVDRMKRDHDVLLIDAPSLLLSADMEFLAVISDVTLMVVETGEATRKELIEGSSILRRIGAPSIGVVMSKVRINLAGRELKQEFKRFTRQSDADAKSQMDGSLRAS